MATPEIPLLRPGSGELAVAPELGVLAVLDAALAMATYQLVAETPELTSHYLLARGDVPCPAARQAAVLVGRIHTLRAALHRYRPLAVGQTVDDPV
jgi:hypothetical protein